MDTVLFESPLEAAEAADEAVRPRLGGRAVGTYLHGSGVLGGFVPGRSDTDVLVVVADDVDRTALTAALVSGDGDRCSCRAPAHRLALVVVALVGDSTDAPPHAS